MSRNISNTDDIVDSRDVIARIAELQEIQDAVDHADPLDADQPTSLDDDEKAELATLKKLADQCEGYGDWEHGATLIRDSYFQEYAEELADDIGAIDRNATWPCNCIDWEKAARELQVDYMSVEWDDVTYWMRS